jgi:hypothetical protein
MGIRRIVLRLVCYGALAFVTSGIAALAYVSAMGGCPRLDEGSVECITPFYESVGSYGLGVVLATLFAGLPGILAAAGVVLLVRDLWRWRKRPST